MHRTRRLGVGGEGQCLLERGLRVGLFLGVQERRQDKGRRLAEIEGSVAVADLGGTAAEAAYTPCSGYNM